MTENLRLVNYFTANFYNGKTTELSHIASPSFTYSANSGVAKTFDEYTKSRDIAFQNVEMFLEEFTSKDDVNFRANYKVKVKAKDKEVFRGDMTLKVVRGLLQSVVITHNLTQAEVKKLNETFVINS